MKQLFCTLLLLTSLTGFSQDPFMVPADAEQFYERSFFGIPSRYQETLVRYTAGSTHYTHSDSISNRLKTFAVFQQLGPASLDSMTLYAMIRFSRNDISTMKGLLGQVKRTEAMQKTQPPPAVTRSKPVAPGDERKKAKSEEIEETLNIKLQKLYDRRNAMNTQITQLLQRMTKPAN